MITNIFCDINCIINTLIIYDRKSITEMTIQNTYTDTTANAAGIPTATASQDNKDMFIGDNTDIEKGGAASHFVQPPQQAAPVTYLTPSPAVQQLAQAQPQSSGCNTR